MLEDATEQTAKMAKCSKEKQKSCGIRHQTWHSNTTATAAVPLLHFPSASVEHQVLPLAATPDLSWRGSTCRRSLART